MTAPNPATSTVAALAWLEHVLPADVVAARALPKAVDVTPAMREWGIVVPSVVGGGGGPDDAPIREPVIGVACWVPPPTPESDIVPVARAERLANWVWTAASQSPPEGYVLRPADFGVKGTYPRVWVRTVAPLGEPREVPNDPANYGHFDISLHIHWTEL